MKSCQRWSFLWGPFSFLSRRMILLTELRLLLGCNSLRFALQHCGKENSYLQMYPEYLHVKERIEAKEKHYMSLVGSYATNSHYEEVQLQIWPDMLVSNMTSFTVMQYENRICTRDCGNMIWLSVIIFIISFYRTYIPMEHSFFPTYFDQYIPIEYSCWLTLWSIFSSRFIDVDINKAMQRVLKRHISTGMAPCGLPLSNYCFFFLL